MQPLRAAIYARVSTAEQVEGTSLAVQVERCRDHAGRQGWTVIGEWIDKGVSGAKQSRPELDRLLAGIRAGNVDVVVVAKLDRIGRSMRHLALLLGELDDRSVGLVSVAEAFDSATPSGRLQRNMLASFAEFEREQIRERMTAGQEARARHGRWIGGPPPYGYRVEHDADGAHLVIDAGEAAIIRTAFELLVKQRLTTGETAAELNGRGMRPRRATRWTGHNLRSQLRDAVVVSGRHQWRREGRGYRLPPIAFEVPAILGGEEFEHLRARLAETSVGHTMHPDRYLLSGRIRSPHGAPMYGFRTHATVYRCAHTFEATTPPEDGRCSCRTVRADTIEAAVWAEVRSLLADPTRLLAMAGLELARQGVTDQGAVEDLAAIDRRISRLERAAGEQLSKLLANGVDPVVAQNAAQALSDELVAARQHRQRVAAWQVANSRRTERAQRLRQLAGRAQSVMADADTATKRRILDLLDVRVTIGGWDRCVACDGTGWVGTRRERGRVATKSTARICPACHRHRYIPRIIIEGAVPETDSLQPVAASTDDTRWPFRVVS